MGYSQNHAEDSTHDALGQDAAGTLFPMQGKFAMMGLGAAVVAVGLFQSFLVGFAFFVLFACAGAVWRTGESLLAYCLAFQWMEFVAGYLYEQATGFRLGYATSRELGDAVLFSLIGLVSLTVGLRIGMGVVRPWTSKRWHLLQQASPYDLYKLFYCSVAISTVNLFVSISPVAIWYEASQIIENLLKIAGIFLPLLLFTVVRAHRGYEYALFACLLAWLPSLASHMSGFSGVFMLVLVVLTSEWRPWDLRPWVRLTTRRVFNWAATTAVMLVILALFWIGGMKEEWRPRILSGEVSGRPIDKAREFMNTAFRILPQLDMQQAFFGLATRLSSATDYFGLILTRVPAVVEHENGKLSKRALYHITHPRILFPDKPNLGSDSPMARKYAGIGAAGEESGTSIGIGYVSEFYVDFGVPWMWLAILAYGLAIGVLYELVGCFSWSYDMYRTMTFIVLAAFSSCGDIAKGFGGMLQGWIVFLIAFLCAGRELHRWLTVERKSCVA